ncbi:MAG: PASTA domain-containing protein [candidate division Zixibacteria bacterium]|nr:PASTA domain-containing protein [candidate division Zixibacteria bacterium]
MSFLKRRITWRDLRRWLSIIFICSVLFLILVLFTDTVIMPMVVRHGQESVAPDVSGVHMEEAKRILKEHGFRWEIAAEEFSPVEPRFTVLTQQPAPGLQVKNGRTFSLVISKGGETGMVPELRGLTLRQAKLMLEEDDFKPGMITYDYHDRLPADVIVRTYPPAGAQINRGGTVDLVVNLREGTRLITVPDYLGMNYSDVETDVIQIGLRIGEVSRERDDSVLPETVLSQSLVPGMEVAEGTEISFTLSESKGP